jgi:hypothetical protein
MNLHLQRTRQGKAADTNGAGAAALFAAGGGCFSLAALAVLADKSTAIKNGLIFYKPTGALSGVTTLAIVLWLLMWALLSWRWRNRDVAMGNVAAAAYVLLGLGLLLTFPPVADLF